MTCFDFFIKPSSGCNSKGVFWYTIGNVLKIRDLVYIGIWNIEIRYKHMKYNYSITSVNRHVLKLCSIMIGVFFVQFCRSYVLWFMFHFTPLVDICFVFVGLLFFGLCGVLFNVLNRSVFSFFRRGSPDETVCWDLQILKRAWCVFYRCPILCTVSSFMQNVDIYNFCVVTWNFEFRTGRFL
jgi:hypothetical protein